MRRGSAETVLAANINSLISNPIVLFAAAAVVVVAVVIVLIMLLRGGSKKNAVADEYAGDEAGWDMAQRGQPDRNFGASEQALPWEQGGRGDGGRQPASGRRSGRVEQEWGQPAGAGQRDMGWENQGQPAARGGQRDGDQWGQPEPAMGAALDRRGPQGQGAAWGRDGTAGAGGQGNADWGQAPASNMPAARGNNDWGQAPASNTPAARGGDEWGQAPGAGMRGEGQRGQMQQGWGGNQDQWEQQNGWGQPAPAPNSGDNQWEQPGAAARSGGMQAPAQPAQHAGWGAQGNPEDWEQTVSPQRPVSAPRTSRPAPVDWGQPAQDTADEWGRAAQGGEGQWGQPAAPAQPFQAPRQSRPTPSRPNPQSGMMGQQPAAPARGEWGDQEMGQPAAGGWGARDAAAASAPPEPSPQGWQASAWSQPEPEQPPRSRSGSWGQPMSTSRPQPQSQAEPPAARANWEGQGVADHWDQAAPPPPARTSRPMGQDVPRQPAPAFDAGNEWGAPAPERPAQAAQPDAGWAARDAEAAWQAPEPMAPVWQAPPARTGPTSGPVAPQARNMPDLARVSPESTAYSPPKSPQEGAGESERTVVMRKDSSGERVPGVVIRQGNDAGRTYEMRKDTLRIGRSRESDVFLEDLAVSRLHATIYRDEMGGFRLRDEHSANGTMVNGQRISSEYSLQEGDEIQLGQTILAFLRR